MVPTAQKRHPRVHSWPAIMNVASPLAQHSWMFGQRASSQTVWSLLSLTAALVVLKVACCSPLGRLVRNQAGRRRDGERGLVCVAIGSGFPAIDCPPCAGRPSAQQKRCVGSQIAFCVRQPYTRLHELNRRLRLMVERVVLITGAGQRLGAAIGQEDKGNRACDEDSAEHAE